MRDLMTRNLSWAQLADKYAPSVPGFCCDMPMRVEYTHAGTMLREECGKCHRVVQRMDAWDDARRAA